jgi:NifU-like protein involved in Fe-S cluster formation
MDHWRGFVSQRRLWSGRRAGLSRFPARRPIFKASQEFGMLDEIYNRRILELAADIPRLGRLERPMATATAHSRLCGSKVTVDVTMTDGVVSEFAHEVKACALGQASSSIMARHVIGATPGELRAARDAVRRMLKENGPPPQGRFADAAVLEPVRDFKGRHASTLLTFDAVVDAVGQIEAKSACVV